jgi:radical SAM protein with 4Fe4S-binding SPASM domain
MSILEGVLFVDCNCASCGNPVKNQELPKISSVYFITTLACNLSCKYCFVHQNPKNMSLQVAKDTVDFIMQNHDKKHRPLFNFFGGEPTLRWDDLIVPTVLYIREKYDNVWLGITTNGILLDRDKLEFLKKYNVGLLLSMDGDKITQDINRPTKTGDSSFDILEPKLPMILEYYPNLIFRATTNNDTVQYFVENHKYAVKQGFKRIFNIVNMFADYTQEQMDILDDQIRQLADYYMELVRQQTPVRFDPLCEFFGRIKVNNENRRLNRRRGRFMNVLGHGKCGIGSSAFASVSPDGDIYSCQEFVGNYDVGEKFKIGSIYTGVDDNKRLAICSEFHPLRVRSGPGGIECSECELDYICNGGCLVNNYLKAGDLHIMPPIICHFYRCLYREAIRIMNTMAEEKNELFRNIFIEEVDRSWG